MKVLLFGADGQVGREVARLAPARGVALVKAGRGDADLAVAGEAAALVAATQCDAVVNAAAYTAVDKAESEEALAFAVNAAAPAEMAQAAAHRGLPFIHLSTDYVFDGAGQAPKREIDMPAPLGAYGRTKLAGEEGVIAAKDAHVILRLSWVFSAHGSNFVKTMLRLGRERGSVRVVADQFGKPTPASAAAEAALLVAAALIRAPEKSGVYHFAGDEAVSWADFAEAIFDAAGMSVAVERIGTSDYPTPARRPKNSVLDTHEARRMFGLAAPSWRAALKQVIAELNRETAP